jgi:hypothetical protein
MRNLPLLFKTFPIRTIGLSYAGAVSGADIPRALLLPIRRPPALPVGFLGGHAPRLQTLELHCIPFPTLPKTSFVCNRPCPPHSSVDVAFRVHFTGRDSRVTRDDGHVPFRVGQRIAHHSFSIPEFLPRSNNPAFTSLGTSCPPGSQGVSLYWR